MRRRRAPCTRPAHLTAAQGTVPRSCTWQERLLYSCACSTLDSSLAEARTTLMWCEDLAGASDSPTAGRRPVGITPAQTQKTRNNPKNPNNPNNPNNPHNPNNPNRDTTLIARQPPPQKSPDLLQIGSFSRAPSTTTWERSSMPTVCIGLWSAQTGLWPSRGIESSMPSEENYRCRIADAREGAGSFSFCFSPISVRTTVRATLPHSPPLALCKNVLCLLLCVF